MRPMLAADADIETLDYPLLASPKYDGVRCIVKDGLPMSRSGKPLPNHDLQHRVKCARRILENLDGEIVIGSATAENAFIITTSAVMSKTAQLQLTFFIFDDITDPEVAYEERCERLRDIGRKALPDWCKIVEQTNIESREDLLEYERRIVEGGYEGIILRNPDAAYKFGRSTAREQAFLRVKRFHDSEAVIVGFQELFRGAKSADATGDGTLGALLVRDAAIGKEFAIGTGFDNAQRHMFWENRGNLNGRIVKYKYMPHGPAVFLGLRDSIDI